MDGSAPARPRSRTGVRRVAPAPEAVARFRAAERRIAAAARLLDDLVEIPGTGRRIGLEPVIGLVPIAGDVVTAGASALVVLEAARFGVPRVVLARMGVNVLVDLALGAVPVVGDLFDFGFKANTRNLELFRRHALDPGVGTRAETASLAGLALVLVGLAWLALVLVGRLLAIEIPVP